MKIKFELASVCIVLICLIYPDGLAMAQPPVTPQSPLHITSTAFKHHQSIPKIHTCQGSDINPPLTITNIPAETQSLALIVEDPDAPVGIWIHWLVFNIPPTGDRLSVKENSMPGIPGKNSWNHSAYGGPCPPTGTHRYFFRIYALDKELDIKEGCTKIALLDAMKNHILAQGELMGLYQKH